MSWRRHARRAALVSLGSCGPLAHAQDLPPVVVHLRSSDLVGVADSATEGQVTARQLATRPLLRAAEVLEAVPGMTVTQHSGDGKANQYFLRGFNLDHGSDFATWVNGMPVNEVTHAHGQGYTDLNFLIPELVERLAYRKGAHSAEDGDFSVAGSARIQYLRRLDAPFVDLSAGSNGYRRGLVAGGFAWGEGARIVAAFEGAMNDGPWVQPERLRKLNGFVRLAQGDAVNGFDLTAMAYGARWTSTEQVPLRAIEAGEIGRFGTLAPTDGGITHRRSLSGEWRASGEAGGLRASAYVIDYGLSLFSTPSGLLDPQHEQRDRRTTWGGSLTRSWAPWRSTEFSAGIGFRQDRLPRLGLYETTDRVRTATLREDEVVESAVGLHAEARTAWTGWLRTTAGLRGDRIGGRVTPLGGDFDAANGGSVHRFQASPRLGVVLGPSGLGPLARTELYANWGRGFHSNDLRGATAAANPSDGSAVQRVPVISPATTVEAGLRTTPATGWNAVVSVWATRLASELVYVGDQGVTEPRGGSRRHGIELWNDWAARDWLVVDADLALSHARFDAPVDGGRHVPNAIPRSASIGVSADARGAWYGAMRLRYIGAYPLEETGVQRSSAFVTANLRLGYRVDHRWRVSVDVLNALDRRANDIEYWGTACTRAEGAGCNGGAGIEGKLVHPLEPRTVRLSLHATL